MIHTRDLKWSDYELKKLKVDIFHWEQEIKEKQARYMQIKSQLQSQGGGNEADDESDDKSDATMVTKSNDKMEIDSDAETNTKTKTKTKVKKINLNLANGIELVKQNNNNNNDNTNNNTNNNNNNSEISVQGSTQNEELSKELKENIKKSDDINTSVLSIKENATGNDSGELAASNNVVVAKPVGVNKELSSRLPIMVVAANENIEERAGSTDAVHGGDDSGSNNNDGSGASDANGSGASDANGSGASNANGSGSGPSSSGSGSSSSNGSGSGSGTSTETSSSSDNNNSNAPPPAAAKSPVKSSDNEDASLKLPQLNRPKAPNMPRAIVVLRDYNKVGPVVPTLPGNTKPRPQMIYGKLPSLGECPIKLPGSAVSLAKSDNDASGGGSAPGSQ